MFMHRQRWADRPLLPRTGLSAAGMAGLFAVPRVAQSQPWALPAEDAGSRGSLYGEQPEPRAPAQRAALLHACALGRWCSQARAERVFGAFMAEASCVRHNWRPASPAEAAVSKRGCSGSVTTPAGSNWRSLTRSSLTAGDPECLERVRGRPIAVRDARRWYGRRRANRPEPAVGSAPRSLVRERVDRGPGGLLVPTGVGEPG